jgi:CRP-like cAMP-binding protein
MAFNPSVLWKNPFAGRSTAEDGVLSFLSTIELFDGLSQRQLRKVAGIIHIRSYGVQEVVFRQGDPGVGMYLVMEGEAGVFRERRDFTCQQVALFTRGDFFGDIALLNDSPRSATVLTLRPSVLLGLFRPDLLDLTSSDPKLGVTLIYRIAQVVAERLRLATAPSD